MIMHEGQRSVTETALEPDFLQQFPGLTALKTLPEHKSADISQQGQSIAVEVVNKDGYSVHSALRKPSENDFKGHPEKQQQSVGQLIIDGDITITTPEGTIQLLKALQTRILDAASTTIAVEAQATHLQHIPITNDVIARSLFYASRGELNARGNTANHKESNSVRLDVLPTTDLSIFFLVHELLELNLLATPLSEQVMQAKAASNEVYMVTKAQLVAANMIKPSERGMALMTKIVDLANRSSGSSDLQKALADCAAKYHWYMATKKMALAEQERGTNATAFTFMLEMIPGLSADKGRVKRLRNLVAVLNRWYDRQVITSQLHVQNLTSDQSSYDIEAFVDSRSYDFPTDALDTTLQTWVSACKKFAA